jgi:hypothetical protein
VDVFLPFSSQSRKWRAWMTSEDWIVLRNVSSSSDAKREHGKEEM